MRRAPEITEFYGVEVSDYQIVPLQGRKASETEGCRLSKDTAHLFAYAYQKGYQLLSGTRVVKTVKSNLARFGRNQATVYRLDRAFNNYSHNPFAQTFKKKKKINIHPNLTKPKKQKTFQVQSPEQIVIKCARQAYVRQLLSQPAVVNAKSQKKEISQSLKRRKAHQKERRTERTLIIKAYRDYLLDIFGNIVFSRGWRISREELKAELQLPIEKFAICYMMSILRERQSLAAQRLIAYHAKKAAYLKEKRERLKMLKYLRAIKKNNYVPYEKRRECFDKKVVAEMKYDNGLKYKAAKEKGERAKLVRRRKMDKIKNYYRGPQNPSSKELEKQALEATFDSDLQEDNEEMDLSATSFAKDEVETVQQ